jgi:hypothetical protein
VPPSSPVDRVRRLCLALPDAWEKVSHGEPTFWVGTKMFATFANAANHHGAGRHAVWCKATPATQDLLVPRRPNWADVAERLAHAHQLAAPPRARAAGRRGRPSRSDVR